jgi:hypothetical protein
MRFPARLVFLLVARGETVSIALPSSAIFLIEDVGDAGLSTPLTAKRDKDG